MNTIAYHLDLDLHSFTIACRTSRSNIFVKDDKDL